jgi:hypothetical protein
VLSNPPQATTAGPRFGCRGRLRKRYLRSPIIVRQNALPLQAYGQGCRLLKELFPPSLEISLCFPSYILRREISLDQNSPRFSCQIASASQICSLFTRTISKLELLRLSFSAQVQDGVSTRIGFSASPRTIARGTTRRIGAFPTTGLRDRKDGGACGAM